MTEILLFHHAQGLTSGVRAFADELRAADHVVHTPDLYDGKAFDTLDEGLGHAKRLGFDTVAQRGKRAADGLPAELVYAGFSLGVMAAQDLAQNRPGAKGALFIDACMPPEEFGGPWPNEVPLQIHGMDADKFFAEEDGDLGAARALVAAADDAELFLYSGDKHLFADSSLASYDAAAAMLLTQRTLDFLTELS
ncbi:MAG: dienelactone hydrolase family protein [Stackebrandtia sp.]